jgi:hypothetical protein
MPSDTISFLRDHLFTLPVLAKFAVGMVMLVIIPRLSRLVHVPAAVGLLLSGDWLGRMFSTSSARSDRLQTSWRSWVSCC